MSEPVSVAGCPTAERHHVVKRVRHPAGATPPAVCLLPAGGQPATWATRIVRTGAALGAAGVGLMGAAGADRVDHSVVAAVGMLVVYVSALVVACAGGWARRKEGIAWLLLGGALSTYAASACVYALDPAVACSFPSVADIGVFVFYPLGMVALVRGLRLRAPALGLVDWADMSISAFSLAAVGAVVLLPASLKQIVPSQLAYVVGDLVLAGFLAATLTVVGRGPRPSLYMLGLGMVLLTTGDAVYAGAVAAGHVDPGAIPSLAWPVGVLIIAVAPAVQRRRRGAAPARERAPLILPLMSAAVCLPLSIVLGRADPTASVLAGVALTAVLARLSLSLRERERLVRCLSEANDDLADAALHDVLTGLGNRDLLTQVAEAGGTRRDGDRGLVVVDLDEFKAINDTFGHGVGDQVLLAVADRLRDAVRPQDLVVRLGGDEFAALLSPADVALSRKVAERFLASLQDPLQIDGQTIFAQASVGVAVASGREPLTTLLSRADASMYRAKTSVGIERVSVFDPQTHHQILDNLALASDLRGALSRNELVLEYQPIVALESRQPAGFEVLVRWQHPERGVIGPLAFIPLAEQGGLMPALGQWILEHACREAVRWCASRGAAPYVSVNLSVRQLQDADFLKRFHRAVGAAQLPLDRLVVELTETALAAEHGTIQAPLEELRRLGVRVYIDDFGTGYSSLAYIRDLPLDGVKLDRSFTRDLTTSAKAWTVAQAMVAMLDNLGLCITAEGVESAAQLAQLRSLGCRFAQGYYFARPQRAEALRALRAPAVAAVTS